MKTLHVSGAILKLLVLVALVSCKKKKDDTPPAKDPIPVVSTNPISSVTPTSATGGGNVSSEGATPVTAYGICWSTNANPDISQSHTSDGSGKGTFNSSITGIQPNTTYHVRAYATNSNGTAYGDDVSFTTPDTWKKIATVNFSYLYSLPSGIYGAGPSSALFRSTDNGANWSTVPISGNIPWVPEKVIEHNGYIIGTPPVGGPDFYLARAAVGGTAWTSLFQGLPGQLVVDVVSNGTVLFAALNNTGIYKSTDDGLNWSQVNDGLGINFTNNRGSLRYDNGVLYCNCAPGVFKSTDNGNTWTKLGNLNTVTSTVGSICLFDSKIFVIRDFQVYSSTDNGATWTIQPNQFTRFAVCNGNLYAIRAANFGVMSLRPGETQWNAFNSGLNNSMFTVDIVSNTNYLLMTGNNTVDLFKFTF